MIVVLCDSFQDAQDAFDVFVQFLEEVEPFSILEVYENCLCVDTDDDLRYVFVDYHLANEFSKMTPDILDADEFFEGLVEYYGWVQ